jgi:hypothetical protein
VCAPGNMVQPEQPDKATAKITIKISFMVSPIN